MMDLRNQRSARLSLSLSLALVALTACMPVNPPVRSRPAPLPERLGTAGVPLGVEVRPVPVGILGAIAYDLPLEANSWVEAELNFLLRDRRDVVNRWLERGDFYEEFVKSVFSDYGIPTDLYHLAMIESGFIPTARSPAGAAGMWQFMPATSGDVNLRIDPLVDERLDPVRSTRAAARHLRGLYRVHGDWALAAAAYNAGSGRISRGLDRYGVRNFWDLASRGDLAPETQHYVPRLYAMTIIARDRQRFGFAPSQVSGGFAFDSIHVDRSLTLRELEEITGVPEGRIASLNPHLHTGVSPATGYWIWVPSGTGVEAQRAFLTAAQRRERDDSGLGTYTVRWGDSLSRLVQLSGVGAARIRELNPDVDFDRLQTGAILRLPGAAAEQLAARPAGGATGERTASPAPPSLALSVGVEEQPRERVHQVRAGDTLSEIAQEYGVTVNDLQQANAITGVVIRPGQRIAIPDAELDASVEPAAVEHVVAAGDTLWGIARNYGSSVEAIRDANELGDRPIRPGQKLNVPASRR